MRSFDRAMPEEVNRVLTDHLGALLLCSSEVAARNLRARGGQRGGGGRRRRDGRRRRGGPAARRASRIDLVQAHGVAPGAYLLATAHRAGNVDDPERLGRLVELLLGARRADRAAAAPADARAAASAPVCSTRLADGGVGARDRAARLLRADGAAVQRPAVLTDSGGLQKEAYLAGVPCRDAAAEHRVDRDRRSGLEHARRPRPATPRRRRSRRRRRSSVRRCTATATPASASSPRWSWPSGEAVSVPRAADHIPTLPARWPPRPIRIGVAGLGYWGPNLARNFAALPGCELRWCCDASEAARGQGRSQFPGARVTAELSTTCSTTRSSTRSRWRRRSRPTPSWPCGCWRRASTASSRSRWRSRSPTPSARSPPPRGRPDR